MTSSLAVPSPRPSSSDSAATTDPVRTKSRRWSVRQRLSSVAGRTTHVAPKHDQGVDDELWDKNEAAFLQEAAAEQAAAGPLSPRLSFVSPASSHRALRSPSEAPYSPPTPQEGASWIDPRLSFGLDFQSTVGSAMDFQPQIRRASRPASRTSRPSSRSSLQSFTSRGRFWAPSHSPSGFRESEDASSEVSEVPSALPSSGVSSAGDHSQSGGGGSGPKYTTRNRSLPLLRRQSSGRRTNDQFMDGDQTVLPRLSRNSSRGERRLSRPDPRQHADHTGPESFLPRTSGESDGEHETIAQAGPSRITLEDMQQLSMSSPPPLPPKSPPPSQLALDAQAMPPPSSSLRPARPAHPFRFRSNSTTPTSTPYDPGSSAAASVSPDVASTPNRPLTASNSSKSFNPEKDSEKGSKQRGFLRGIRSREPSANGALSPASSKDKESPGLVEGLRKLIKKDRPSTANSSPASASTPQFASPQGVHPEAARLVADDVQVVKPDHEQSSSPVVTASTSRDRLEVSEAVSSTRNHSQGVFRSAERAILAGPHIDVPSRRGDGRLRSHTAGEPRSAAQDTSPQRRHDEIRDAFLARSRRPSALSQLDTDSPQLTRAPSTSSNGIVRSGRPRRDSRAESVSSKASVIEHVSYEEARRRSGLEGPIVLHNGISVGDLRSQSLRRGSISSQLPPEIPVRPHRDLPPKAGRLLGISPPSPRGGFAGPTEQPEVSSPGSSLMDRFNDSHSIRWNNANPWDTRSRSSHASSSRYSKNRTSPFTPTTTTTTTASSDTHSIFSAVPGSVTSSISSYQRSELSSGRHGKSHYPPPPPPVDPLAAAFALHRVRRSSSGTGLSTKKRLTSLFGRGGSGRTPNISSSNISRPVSVAGSTLSDGVESTTSSTNPGEGRIKASTSGPAKLSATALGKMPARDSDGSSQGGLGEMCTSPSQVSLSGSSSFPHRSRSINSGVWPPHARMSTAPSVSDFSHPSMYVHKENAARGGMHAQQHFAKERLSPRSQTALHETVLNRLNDEMEAADRRPSLNEHLLSPVMPSSELTSRARRPSADSVFASRLHQSYKRPTFGLDLQPDAAAAFDCIPSPHIVKGPVSGSKATSLSGSRRSAASTTTNAFAGQPTARSSGYSGGETDTRPTSQGEHMQQQDVEARTSGSGIIDKQVEEDERQAEEVVEEEDSSKTAPLLLSSRPLPADAPSSPDDEMKATNFLDDDVEDVLEQQLSPPSVLYRWYIDDEAVAPVDGEGEHTDRLELLEDIQEHPSFSSSQCSATPPVEDYPYTHSHKDAQDVPHSVHFPDGSPTLPCHASSESESGTAGIIDVRSFDWL